MTSAGPPAWPCGSLVPVHRNRRLGLVPACIEQW
ncbi:Uncharacterised protein [Bordetella pertussis]|nr:Uncharacterised protein [Bordetella pertussis]